MSSGDCLPRANMADETGRQEVTDVTATDDVAAWADPKAAGGEGESKDPDASSSASTGKRPMDDTVEDEVGNQNEQSKPLRKKPRHQKANKEFAATGASKSVVSDSVDEGEVDSEGASKKTESASSDGQDSAISPDEPSTTAAPAAAPPGLRTSFGTSSQGSSNNVQPDMLMYNPLTTELRDQLLGAIRAGESMNIPPMQKQGLDWAVPPIRSDWVVGATWLEVFNSVIDKWCEGFVAENQKNVDEAGLATSWLRKTFLRCLRADVTPYLPQLYRQTAIQQLKNPHTSRLREFGSEDFKPTSKKAAKRAAKREAELQQQAASGASTTPNSTASTSKPPTNNNSPPSTNVKMDAEMENSDHAAGQQHHPETEIEDGEIGSGGDNGGGMEIDQDESGSSIPEAELDQRRRYFPKVSDEAIFCLTCAQYGHRTAACPVTTCKYCHGDHFKYECLTRQRCTKCKQLGHTKGSCPEKLAVAPGEAAMQCAVCELHDHTEMNCSELWQTYRPQPGNVKKVRSLPVFCYCCGNDGHFGGDCGLADPSTPPTKTWTMATASLYIDHETNEDALVYKGCLAPPQALSKPVIPGRSIKPQSHVVYESDDSGEVDGMGFLHAPATEQSKKQKQSTKQKKQGAASTKIKIQSNINFGAAASAAGGPGPATQQNQNPQPLVQGLPGTKTSGRRYPDRQRNEPPPPPFKPLPQPPMRGGKNYSLRNGREVPKAGQGERLTRKEQQQSRQAAQAQGQQQQQPPLPPGPVPAHLRAGRGGGGGGRGRGGGGGLSGGSKRNNRSGRGGSR